MFRIDFNRLRFLVIEDSAHMRRILRTLLHGLGAPAGAVCGCGNAADVRANKSMSSLGVRESAMRPSMKEPTFMIDGASARAGYCALGGSIRLACSLSNSARNVLLEGYCSVS